jgi:hypothetical protein
MNAKEKVPPRGAALARPQYLDSKASRRYSVRTLALRNLNRRDIHQLDRNVI